MTLSASSRNPDAAMGSTPLVEVLPHRLGPLASGIMSGGRGGPTRPRAPKRGTSLGRAWGLAADVSAVFVAYIYRVLVT